MGEYDDYKKSYRENKNFSFDEALDKTIHKLTKNNPSFAQNTKIMLAWEDVCPPYFYKHTTSVQLRGSKLVITIDTPSLATDLSAMSEVYKDALNEKLGEEKIGSVSFFVASKGSKASGALKQKENEDKEEKVKSEIQEVEAIPLTDVEREQIEASVASVNDEKLRKALLKATIADLEWKKGIEQSKRAKNSN